MEPWKAEIELDSSAARGLIQTQFPDISISEFSLLGEGWDNYAYLVNKTILFRFPRRKIALEGFKTELKVLDKLSPLLPLKIPIPKYIGSPTDKFPCPFAGYPLLAGTTACHVRLTREMRKALVVPLARFLKTLHHIEDPEILSHLNPDPFSRLDIKAKLPRMQDLLLSLYSLDLIKSLSVFQNYLENFDPNINITDNTKCVVHGDLYSRHILLNEDNQVTGIIDWGDVHYGNPAVDLENVIDFLPKEYYPDFIKEYGPIDQTILQLAIFRSLYRTLTTLEYSYKIADKMLLAECQQGLEFIAEWLGS